MVTKTELRKAESRLRGMTPSKMGVGRVNDTFMRMQGPRTPFYELTAGEREIMDFPLTFLKERGVNVPVMDEKTIYVATGPRSGRLESRDGTFSVECSGNDILYSINGGPKKKMNKRGLRG